MLPFLICCVCLFYQYSPLSCGQKIAKNERMYIIYIHVYTYKYIYIHIYIYVCVCVFISTSWWWAYKIQIEVWITCNLYTHIYAGSTQQYSMITVTDDIDSLQVQLTGSPRERHAKTHAGPPTGIPQPGPRLVGGCSASQSEAWPENPCQPTRIRV